MKIQTLSILTGSEACNARCPFCISRMTPSGGVGMKKPKVNWRNFEIACRAAKQCGVTTVMFTGKGEPTLFPDQITQFLKALAPHKFPFIELQTNGILLAEDDKHLGSYMRQWYRLGLTTIAISIVHYDAEKNGQVYLPHRGRSFDLARLIDRLHRKGFSVRLTCMLARGYIDSVEELRRLIEFALEHKVEQLTVTPINKPEVTENTSVWRWVLEHHLTAAQRAKISKFLEHNGARIMELPHGAVVYDVGGQNVCLNNCLSPTKSREEMRNLIFFPDGHLRYDWQYAGSVIM